MRARQRNIHPSLIQLVFYEGVPLSRNPNRLLLGKRAIKRLKEEGRVDRKLLQRAEKAGPLVCVVLGNTIRTIFRVNRTVNRSR